MAAEEGIQEAETEETQSPAAFKRQGGQDRKQKPPLELETLHQMLTMNLKAAEEEAKHFAALSKKLTEKNKELATENSILREQNEILMKQKAMQQRQEKREKEFIAMAKQGNIKASLETPEVSPRLLGPPLTPRTVAKVKAKIRQYTKGNNYERELKMRAEISRLHELCKRQKTELIILKGTDGRRVELELLLKVIKLLHQIVSTTGTASEFDFSWLDREEDETEVDCGASVSPPPTCVKTTTSHASNRKPK
ncbi:hypothetical protein, conserved [Eimeria praecox]|uniref:Uncharacterized protein n=1 Tax=Eimeria praecox TaxID=51316 RepID=U6H1T4_9EIME|nr:hypothetical protein, conserved [Eimeria praecox]